MHVRVHGGLGTHPDEAKCPCVRKWMDSGSHAPFLRQYRLVIGGQAENTCLTPENCHLETVS